MIPKNTLIGIGIGVAVSFLIYILFLRRPQRPRIHKPVFPKVSTGGIGEGVMIYDERIYVEPAAAPKAEEAPPQTKEPFVAVERVREQAPAPVPDWASFF